MAVIAGGLGCSTRHNHFVSRNIRASGNVNNGGNVFVHISNQGLLHFVSIDFEIKAPKEEYSGWDGGGEIEFDPHGYYLFSFDLPPGDYELMIDDGITNEQWIFPFAVSDDKETHLDVTYWLRHAWDQKLSDNHAPRMYYSEFQFKVGDSAPVVF